MKKNFSLVWRVAIALVLVISLGLTATVPVGAADPVDGWVTSVDILGPTGTNLLYINSNIYDITVNYTVQTQNGA